MMLSASCAPGGGEISPPDSGSPRWPTEAAPGAPAPTRPQPKLADPTAVYDRASIVATGADGTDRVRLLVRFGPQADRAPALALVDRVAARVAYRYRLLPDLIAVRALPTGALDALARAPGVTELLPDQVRHAYLDESLAVMNAGAATLGAFSDGSGVRVCVLDSGLTSTHPAFAGALVAQKDFVNDDNVAQDDHGHGTNVAGIVASRDDTFGGVAPGASLVIGKVLDSDGSGFDSDIIAAVEWCTFDADADIVNMSLGGGLHPGSCDWDALSDAVNTSVDNGVVHVIAAGNEGQPNALGSPACASRAIAVGAVYDDSLGTVSWCLDSTCNDFCTDANTAADDHACFSNRAIALDVVAPGSSITAPHAFSTGFTSQSGTSQATPHVAGLVARLLGVHPDLTPADVRRWLWANAVDLGAGGFDDTFGHGRVDALATLSYDRPISCVSPTECDDGDPCTLDVCVGAVCGHRPECWDVDGTTADTCSDGSCTHTAIDPDDGRDCTSDTLDPCLGALHQPNDGTCNETCALAVPVPVGATVSGTTSGASFALSSSCAGSLSPGRDVFYRVRLRPDQPVTITVDPQTSWNPQLYVLAADGAGCDDSRCLGGINTSFSGGTEVLERLTVPYAGDYIIAVDASSSFASGPFTLSVVAACQPEEAGRACDDGNECTRDDVCDGEVCAGQSADCDDDAECGDGDECNGIEVCTQGVCQPGPEPDCDDGNECTEDSCPGPAGCLNDPVEDGTDCDDGDVCNGIETCQSGICTGGAAPDCDDGESCTVDSCDELEGCQHDELDDGELCGDDDVCNGIETCLGGICQTGEAIICSDGDPCNGLERCDDGECFAGPPPSCDDDNPCTDDSCVELEGCRHEPVEDGTSCDDHDICNGTDACRSGRCRSTGGLSCNDRNPCTADQCHPSQGCRFPPLDGKSCSDGNFCNGAETCSGSLCRSGFPPTCDDGNPCTSDWCDPASGCRHSAVTDGTVCSDANHCNGTEVCRGGLCRAGTALDCDDGNPCTDDSCLAASGCRHPPVPNGHSCADEDACNGIERCRSGTCVAGEPVVCDDDDVCNGLETCVAGICKPGSALTCEDDNPCTSDRCDPRDGCRFDLVADGTVCGPTPLCDGRETCRLGVCVGGAPLDCDDGNPCTRDSCDNTLGCQHEPLTGDACGDGDVCNGEELCESGSCLAGTPLDCDDDNVCTADGCDARGGCHNTPHKDGLDCDDGDGCTGTDRCSAGICAGREDLCGEPQLLFALAAAAALPGHIHVGEGDVASYDVARDIYTIYLDGSDLMTGGPEAIDAVAIDAGNNVLLSFRSPVTVDGLIGGPGGKMVAPQDIVAFQPASLGSVTAGTFTFLFDGSDVGLRAASENISALAILPDGDLVISTSGAATVAGVSATGLDLLRFSPSSLGAATRGTWSRYFDGSDVGLALAGVSLDAVALLLDGSLLLSTDATVEIGTITAHDEDILRFFPNKLGPITAGDLRMYLDGSAVGLSAGIKALESRASPRWPFALIETRAH